MQHSLILRLKAPSMSFAFEPRGAVIKTDIMPRKSHITGMVAAALGRQRQDGGWPDLNRLKCHVRSNSTPVITIDFATARSPRANSATDISTSVTDRHELYDADFTVVLEGDLELLEEIEAAFFDPKFSVYIGRKAHAFSRPICEKPYGSNIVAVDGLTALQGAYSAVELFVPKKKRELVPIECHVMYEVDFSHPTAPMQKDVFLGRNAQEVVRYTSRKTLRSRITLFPLTADNNERKSYVYYTPNPNNVPV